MRSDKIQRFFGIFILMLAVYINVNDYFNRPIIQWIDEIDLNTILWFMTGFATGFLIVYLSSKLEGKNKDRYDIF